MRLKCLNPFSDFEIGANGEVVCCCWGKYASLGNLKKNSISEIWISKQFQSLRKNIYDNHFSQSCDLKLCHNLLMAKTWEEKDLINQSFPDSFINELKQKKTKLSTGPYKIILSDNGRCNLNCIMCYRSLLKDDDQFSIKLFKEIIPEFLKDQPKRKLIIKLTGNGDPFFRKEVKEFLQSFDNKKYPFVSFDILTNGILLTPETWQTISHNHINEINVSLDAACKKTYEKIRKGGDWEKLMENLKFISRLRKKRKINYFYINMVVMKSNFKEMKDFVLLGKKLGCDEVNFQKITGLHNFKENFNDFNDSGIIAKIKEILKDPVFKGEKDFFVNWFQLREYLNFNSSLFNDFTGKIKKCYYQFKLSKDQ